jgi:hypothetical protein
VDHRDLAVDDDGVYRLRPRGGRCGGQFDPRRLQGHRWRGSSAGNDAALPSGNRPAKDLALKKLTFDEGGTVKYTTDAQLKALQDQVVELVKHIFEPFDIEVKADSIEKLLKKNNSDPTGHNDAYVLGGNFLPSARPGKYSVTWGRHGPGT